MASFNVLRLGHYIPSGFKQGSNTVDAMYMGDKLVYEKVTTVYSVSGFPTGVEEDNKIIAGNKFSGVLVANSGENIGMKYYNSGGNNYMTASYNSVTGEYSCNIYTNGEATGYLIFGPGFTVSDIAITGSDTSANIVSQSTVTPVATKVANFPITAPQPNFYPNSLSGTQTNLRGLTVVEVKSTLYTYQEIVFTCKLTEV